MFKKYMIVLAAALCVVSLTACGNQKAEAQQQTAQAEADLKIGAPAPDID
ncbi:MAG: TlpA family protein disulfide reductase, partial [Megasphaera micronuciformis]|nr:TlpA family protein disulfide reductase [Megasphaera micronuciformis]